MNVLSMDKKKQVLSILVEGNSIRSAERLTGVHRDTIMRLLVKVGESCELLMESHLKDFHSTSLQVDEIWCYVGMKENTKKRLNKKDASLGDQYVFIALDADSKLVPLFMVGKRTEQTATRFMSLLQDKIKNNGRVQLTTDGLKAYLTAVESAFGGDVDYAQLIKVYGKETRDGEQRYSPPSIQDIISKIITGSPDTKKISTSYIERQNLTVRMQLRRFTRLTNAFSKKLDNLKAALALHFAHYNFMRVHKTLSVTPAMEAKITDHIWVWDEILCPN